MKSQSRGRSATLTNAPALFAAARASADRRRSSVATKQSAEPSKSFRSGSRASWRKFGASRSPRKSSLRAVANVVTRAPALTRYSARRAATTPPPTTTAGRSLRSRKIGRWRIAIARGVSFVRDDPPRAGGPARNRLNSQLAVLGLPAPGSKENKRYSCPNRGFRGLGRAFRRRGAVRGSQFSALMVFMRSFRSDRSAGRHEFREPGFKAR